MFVKYKIQLNNTEKKFCVIQFEYRIEYNKRRIEEEV